MKCFWCHNNVLVHTTGNQRHQFATIYFQYALAFYNCVEDGRITNFTACTIIPQKARQDIHIVCMYTSLYFLYCINLKYWSL